jgi:quercetin dioxygenase-like cupin family protein
MWGSTTLRKPKRFGKNYKNIMKSTAYLLTTLLLCSAIACKDSKEVRSTTEVLHLHTGQIPWRAVNNPNFPQGLQEKLLHQNSEKQTSVAMVKFPKGYLEPRHFHTTAGHYGYMLSGKMISDGMEVGPGDFLYFPANVEHGPNLALTEVELLRWSDGPLDLHLVEQDSSATRIKKPTTVDR